MGTRWEACLLLYTEWPLTGELIPQAREYNGKQEATASQLALSKYHTHQLSYSPGPSNSGWCHPRSVGLSPSSANSQRQPLTYKLTDQPRQLIFQMTTGHVKGLVKTNQGTCEPYTFKSKIKNCIYIQALWPWDVLYPPLAHGLRTSSQLVALFFTFLGDGTLLEDLGSQETSLKLYSLGFLPLSLCFLTKDTMQPAPSRRWCHAFHSRVHCISSQPWTKETALQVASFTYLVTAMGKVTDTFNCVYAPECTQAQRPCYVK